MLLIDIYTGVAVKQNLYLKYLFLVVNSSEIHHRQLAAAVSDVQCTVMSSNSCDPVNDRLVVRLKCHMIACDIGQIKARLQVDHTVPLQQIIDV